MLARLVRADYIVARLRRWSYGENIAWGPLAWRTEGDRKSVDAPPRAPGEHPQPFDEIGIGFGSGYPRSANADGATYTTDFGMRHR